MAPRLLKQIIRPPDDLTRGSILRNVIILSLPVALTQSFTVLFQFVDTIFIGHLPYSRDALAAVGLATHVLFLTVTMLIGFTIGTTAMVARFVGEKEPDKAAVTVFNSFILCLALSIALALIGILLSEWILSRLGAEGEVLRLGVEYLEVLMVASVAMVMLFLIVSILQGAGDGITPMWLLGGANLVNLILDPIFIYDWGLGLGVRGAAFATVIGRGLFCLVGVAVLRRGLSRVHVEPRHFRLDFGALGQLIAIGVPSALQMMTRAAARLWLIGIIATGFGKTAVAGFTAASRIIMLALMPGFGIGRASGALAGQNLGARQQARAVRSVWTSVTIYSVFMAACMIPALFFPRFLVGLFTPNEEVIAAGAVYLRYVASVYLFIGVAIVLGKSMEGAGYTIVPMALTVLALFGVMIPLAHVVPDAFGLGLHGVWIAMLAAYTLHAVGAFAVFQLGKWKAKKIEIDYREVAIPPQEPVAAPE